MFSGLKKKAVATIANPYVELSMRCDMTTVALTA